ncbi:acriflavin resistance protein [Desulfurobacterium thermolithotrophum DSM 11699]|uniref:Acriflavin resistance protein n=1 Tax=Desulfurobacterium thermolithotrophum (strain DSM 11699 / BSA) TaxID=868864 RepID=F0S0B1_DESTD|nr:efflux RND transporter permease subunit [Desulfurobacterium thermolithotrophum]ADY73790.1 acriflavin resistance protein [Desulfurobacterium thermolithotrophum DSM 11699]
MKGEKIFLFILQRKFAISLTLLILSLVGYLVSKDIPRGVFPNVFFPRIEVTIENGFVPVEQMLSEVTKPAEESLKTVQDAEKIVSKTSVGSTEINIYFDWKINPYLAYQLVQARVAELKNRLPSTANVVVRQATPSIYPIAIYAICSNSLPRDKLTEILYYQLKPLFLSIKGVYDIEIKAPEWEEYHVIVDLKKLANYNIDIGKVVSILREQTKIKFLGKLDSPHKQYIISLYQKSKDIYKLLKIKIPVSNSKFISLSDIAIIVKSHTPVKSISAFSGYKNAVVFNLLRQPNANSVEVVKNVDELLGKINASLKKQGIIIKKSYDSTLFIEEAIKSVRDAILLGSVIAVFIIYLFLRKVKLSLATLLTIPVIFFITIIGIKITKLDFNLFSLGGLAAAIGGLIDHIIIVTENIERHLRKGKDKLTAVIEGSKEIIPIMTVATLISIIVFIPLLLVSGIVGVFFKQLALVLVATYIISQILAIFFVPIVAYILLPQKEEKKVDLIERLKEKYANFLRRALKYDYLSVPLIIIGILTTFVLYKALPSTFLPKWDEGNLVVDFSFSPGTSLEEAYKEAMEIGKIINSIPEVENWTLRIGTSLGHIVTQPSKGDFLVVLKSNRKRSIFQIKEELRAKVLSRFPNLQEFDLPQVLEDRLGDIMGAEAPISIILYGSDPEKLIKTGQYLRDILRKQPLLEEVNLKTNYVSPSIQISVKPDAEALYGITVNDIYNQLYSIYWGKVIGNIMQGEKIINIRLLSSQKKSFFEIQKLKVYSPKLGKLIPISYVVDISFKDKVPEITHYNLSPVSVITLRFKGNNMSKAVEIIQKVIKEAKISSSISPVISGFYKEQQKSFKEMLFVIILSIVIILTALMFQFGDFKISISTLLALILTLIGVFMALLLTAKPLDITAFMGMLIVLSIAINNNILIFDFYKMSEKNHLSETEKIVAATSTRFRPIMMTMLSNSFAMLPIALTIGSGTQILQDMAIAIIGGLLFAIFVNLWIIPMFFHFIKKKAI